MKIYSSAEAGHREALRLLHGHRRGTVRQVTSMIVTVELVSALVRRTGDRALATAALRQLESLGQVEFTVQHRDIATRLALSGLTRGADTAIAAQAIVLAQASSVSVEFVTADAAQGKLVRREAKARAVDLSVLDLPV